MSDPLPPLWPERDGASVQRGEGRLLCCCWVTPVDDGGGVEGRRRRLLIYRVKLFALSRSAGENVVSKFRWNGRASPQPEADWSYFRPCPLPPPRPFLLKGRLDEGPLESLSCLRPGSISVVGLRSRLVARAGLVWRLFGLSPKGLPRLLWIGVLGLWSGQSG